MENKKNPVNLTVLRSEAEEKLQTRIAIGTELLSTQITSEAQLDEERAKYFTWSDYNIELLSRLFTSDTIANEYSGLAVGAWAGPTSLETEIENHREDINSKIRRLNSIKERLELIPEKSAVDRSIHLDTVIRNEPKTKGHGKSTEEKEMEFQSKASIKAAWIMALGGIIGAAVGSILTWYLSSSETPTSINQKAWLGHWTYEQNIGTDLSKGTLNISLSGDGSNELTGMCSDKKTGYSELRGRLIHDGRTFTGTWKSDRQNGTFEFYIVGREAIFKGNYSILPNSELRSANWWDGRRRS